MFSRRLLWVVIGLVVLVTYLGSNVLELVVDYLWFSSLGYAQVFQRVFLAELSLGLVGGLIAAAIFYVNLLLALRTIGDLGQYLPPEITATSLGQLLTNKFARRGALGLSLVVGVFAGFTASSGWESMLLYFNGVPFGAADPVFQLDAGFYVFGLPFLDKVQSYFWSIGLLSLMGTSLIYFLKLQSGRAGTAAPVSLSDVSRGSRLHVGGLAAFMLLIMAWGFYLQRFMLMHEPGGLFTGPGYADINGTLPILALKIAAALACAGILIYGLHRGQLKWLLGAVVLLIGVYIGGNVYVSVLQRFVVNPNEIEKERVYLQHHIAATNKAYALDKVEERPLSEDSDLTARDIRENQATVQNIRLWDHEPLLDTFSQLQEIRTYYDFVSVDNDRYVIDGELRQTMLSPRELNPTSLPSRTWLNEKLTFTHGYGLTLGPVNRVDEQGLPVLYVQDLPPRTSSAQLKIERPEIYFGEVAEQPVYVKTKQQEFNYPEGDKNIFSFYVGDAGLSLGSLLRRLLFAAHLRDVKILLADDFTDDTVVLLHRKVGLRVRKIAPFFVYDRDPYMVINEGKLVWILDGYTMSTRYPYAERVSELGNYMRNPVKAIVDAYTGDVNFYLVDEDDPIAQSYSVIFPGMIHPLSEMPKGLREHLRHPPDYFTVQAFMYATYHMLDVNTFYNKEDQWEVPVVGKKRMEPYFTVMKLPGEKKEEFILMLPFTPRLKDNMAAWMVARSDGEEYGKLVAYTFPKQKLIFGPKQMAARINQDGRVSQQITLWDQSGSNVIRGTLLVIPIKSSLIYIQPLYLKAEDGRIPELKRVVVGYQNEIAMGTDLDDALGQIFGTSKGPAAPVAEARMQPGKVDGALKGSPGKAMEHYQRMLKASRDGNWNRFGEELDALGKTLRELNAKQK